MAYEKFIEIGKCDLCGKKQATIIFRRINFIRSCEIHLCEDCKKNFSEINNVLNRRVG